MYGLQKKDGTPNITNVEQIELTSDKIKEFTLNITYIIFINLYNK